ncbi:hypothetical protein DPMN_048463 [Dreissena polymorpha]|uniref:Uncharacterized protein n=1 Tax=Dreissena polymorpha TaxID=45954 RepID=A0A9D4DDG4_DREPO|nr:hypothetical protein DPMN_048463 [Dreissena polymorpha]
MTTSSPTDLPFNVLATTVSRRVPFSTVALWMCAKRPIVIVLSNVTSARRSSGTFVTLAAALSER